MKATPEEVKAFTELSPRYKRACCWLVLEPGNPAYVARKRKMAPYTIRRYFIELLDILRSKGIEINNNYALAVFIVRRPEIEKICREAV